MSADLDDSVRSGGLGKIFKKSPAQELTPAEPKTSRFFHSVSVRTHRDADGVRLLVVHLLTYLKTALSIKSVKQKKATIASLVSLFQCCGWINCLVIR